MGVALLAGTSSPALAQPAGAIDAGDGFTIDPIVDALLRYEHVEQDNARQDADAVTLRARAGFEIAHESGFNVLLEGEGTIAIGDDYDPFPFPTGAAQDRDAFSVVADPENVEVNRAQIGYAKGGYSATVGRQRIVLDDSRFIGNVGWRQNEQTYDAVRLQAKAIGPVSLDLSYAVSQRTIFGHDAEARNQYEGEFWFLNGGVKAGPVSVKAFAYLLDYDGDEPVAAKFSSQTYGVLAKATIPLGEGFAITATGSYARQSDYGSRTLADYDADYIAASLGATLAGFGLTAGYEELGSDNGVEAFQTPMATAHKFNGWADLFLTTPATGIRDYYGTVGRKFGGIKMLPGLNASVTYHQFDSDFGGIDYGSEWDAVLGFRIAPVGVLVKYANYNAESFGVDTERLWIQLAYSF